MSYAVGGIGIVAGTIFHPAEGAWHAELELNSEVALGGAQTLELPGLSLKGYVISGGVSTLRQHVRMVGGAGGLSATVKGQPFNRAQVRTIVNYLLGQAGETLDTASDAAVLGQQLAHWTHRTGSAGSGLTLLCRAVGSTWYVTPAGTVHIGAPDWQAVEPDHTVEAEDLRAGTLTIATLEDTVRPGTSFLGKRVDAVEHTISGRPAQARSYIRWGTGGGHPFDAEMRAMVRGFQERTLPLYGAEVVVQNSDGSLDLKPTHDEVGPGWQRVPLYLVGTATVKVQPGARCVVEFLDNDPQQPFVRSFLSGTFTEISERASSKIDSKAPTMNLGDANAAMVLAGSAKPVVRVGDTLAVGLTSATGGPVTGNIAIAPPLSTVKA